MEAPPKITFSLGVKISDKTQKCYKFGLCWGATTQINLKYFKLNSLNFIKIRFLVDFDQIDPFFEFLLIWEKNKSICSNQLKKPVLKTEF